MQQLRQVTTPDQSRLVDRLQIIDVLSRYFSAIDDKLLTQEIVDLTFTADARLVRPNGVALVGRADILNGQQRSFARFRATHHVTTDHIIDFDDHRAELRANLTAMHLWFDAECVPDSPGGHFVAGGVLRILAEHTPEGWRVSELSLRNTWRSGTGLAAVAGFERPSE